MNTSQDITLKGLPASPGIAIGQLGIWEKRKVEKSSSSKQLTLQEAILSLIEDFRNLLAKAHKEEVKEIFESNILILQDPILLEQIESAHSTTGDLEQAIISVIDTQKSFLEKAPDPTFRDRAEDLENIKQSLISKINGEIQSKGNLGYELILFERITAAEIFKLKDSELLGVASLTGGITSHASILARSFGIPLVVALKEKNDSESLSYLENIQDAEAVIDGYEGRLVISPSSDTLYRYEKKAAAYQMDEPTKSRLIDADCITREGQEIELNVNADFSDTVHQAVSLKADGIGLVRSEHQLLESGKIPSEEEQLAYYRSMAEAAYPLPITIRLFDFGSDKYAHVLGYEEPNPALGHRGIRFLLSQHEESIDKEDSILAIQLRAILRASYLKNISIMIPFVIKSSEVECIRDLIEDIKESLGEEEYDRNIQIGTMIETPAAAVMADKLAEVSDFFSIGSNDLAQYVLAADRMNPKLGNYYRWLDTSLLKVIISIIDSAKAAGIPVSICGEVAGNPNAIPLLLWAGINSLSVNPSLFLQVKRSVLDYSQDSFNRIINSLIDKNDDADLITLIEEFTSKN